jgi:hypothetical protein
MSVGLTSPIRDTTATGTVFASFLFKLEENITCQRTWTSRTIFSTVDGI